MHWPQSVQSTLRMLAPSATSTVVWVARLVIPQTCEAWTLSQTWMQRMQRMHLSLLRMRGKPCGQEPWGRMVGYGMPTRPRSFDTSCSEQLPERTQVVQVASCCERSRSTFSRRAHLTLGLLVRTSIPSSTQLLQEATRRSRPLTSTTQTRQEPISFSSLR